MATITVKCIANSYHNNTIGLSLSKGEEAEIEETQVNEAIKTKYLEKVESTKKEAKAEITESTKTEEKPTTSTKKSK